MNIRGHSNGVAIALAALAVVIAGTGTAAAVTATQVNITDRTTPTRAAHVDSSGRLTTSGDTATLNYLTFGTIEPQTGDEDTDILLTSGTTATIAVTRISVTSGADLDSVYVELHQTNANNDGSCERDSPVLLRRYSYQEVSPHSVLQDNYSTPLLIKPPSKNVKYCLELHARKGVSNGHSDLLYVQFTGYVVSGSYSGIGTGGPR